VQIINLSSENRPQNSTDLTQQGKIAAALTRAGISNPAAWSAAGVEYPSAAIATLPESPAKTSSESAVAASPAQEFDLQPKVVLMKGDNNPAFFISWRNERAIAKSLGWKSAACIWGGPAVILLAAYVLMAQFGLL
jgi:hypothetical protein